MNTEVANHIEEVKVAQDDQSQKGEFENEHPLTEANKSDIDKVGKQYQDGEVKNTADVGQIQEVQQKDLPEKLINQGSEDAEKSNQIDQQQKEEQKEDGEDEEQEQEGEEEQDEDEINEDDIQNEEQHEEGIEEDEDEGVEQDPSLGTKQQLEVVEDYSTRNKREKQRVPYIEKQNGNICAQKQDYENAIKHYNKALFALKMIFESEDPIVNDMEQGEQMINEIELPVCLNLGLCYLKVQEFQYSIKYCTQALDKDEDNDKAYYRRGLAYLGKGDMERAKQDLMKAYDLTEGKDQNIIKALHALKQKKEDQKLQEIEFSKNVIQRMKGVEFEDPKAPQPPLQQTNLEPDQTEEDAKEMPNQSSSESAQQSNRQLLEQREVPNMIADQVQGDNFIVSFVKGLFMWPFDIVQGIVEYILLLIIRLRLSFEKILSIKPRVKPKTDKKIEELQKYYGGSNINNIFEMHRLELLNGHIEPSNSVWVMKNVQPLTFKKVGDLKGKTLLVTGASRGIGLAIALRAAKDGANVAILARTAAPNPKLSGTIYTAAEEIRKAGGNALPIPCDIRDEKSVIDAIELTVKTFGGIDILVNNASSLFSTPVEDTDMKKYDLAMQVNTRGTFLCCKYSIPHLKKSKNPHVLTIAPPRYAAVDETINWYGIFCTAYTISKMGMTFITHGLAKELEDDGVGCNTLWPRTMVATAAVQNLLGGEDSIKRSRTAEIMGDAAYEILTSEAKTTNDNCYFDDEVLLSAHGQNYDLGKYRISKNSKETDLWADVIC